MTDALTAAQARLFDTFRVPVTTRSLRLADPRREIAVHESGSGKPVVLVHGSGMSGATWAPLLAHLPDRRAIAGTSLGAMWALNLALAAPERVSSVVVLGMPAVAL